MAYSYNDWEDIKRIPIRAAEKGIGAVSDYSSRVSGGLSALSQDLQDPNTAVGYTARGVGNVIKAPRFVTDTIGFTGNYLEDNKGDTRGNMAVGYTSPDGSFTPTSYINPERGVRGVGYGLKQAFERDRPVEQPIVGQPMAQPIAQQQSLAQPIREQPTVNKGYTPDGLLQKYNAPSGNTIAQNAQPQQATSPTIEQPKLIDLPLTSFSGNLGLFGATTNMGMLNNYAAIKNANAQRSYTNKLKGLDSQTRASSEQNLSSYRNRTAANDEARLSLDKQKLAEENDIKKKELAYKTRISQSGIDPAEQTKLISKLVEKDREDAPRSEPFNAGQKFYQYKNDFERAAKGTPSFANEKEAMAAVSAGQVKSGDSVIIGGKRATWSN